MRRPWLLLLGLAAGAGAGCAHSEGRRTPPEGPPATVSAVAVHQEPFSEIYRTSGTLRGRNTTVLTSKTLGYVRTVLVRAGDHVTAGQALVELEANDVRASVARARAALGEATEARAEAENGLELALANAKVARASYDRAAELVGKDALSPQQFDDAEARWHAAQAQERMARARLGAVSSSIDQARAGLGEVNATLGYSAITAPFSGRVLERRVDPGALASPEKPLLVIMDESGFRVEAPVAEAYASAVNLGDEVEVALAGAPLAGTIAEIAPSIEPSSRDFLVKIELPAGATHLLSGSFARVGIRLGVRPRTVVPATAVTSFGALDRVFVVEAGRAHLRMIARGETQGPWTEVLAGLEAGERVIAIPPPGLRDGARVEVRP